MTNIQGALFAAKTHSRFELCAQNRVGEPKRHRIIGTYDQAV